MVGDGINDAPALVQADLAVAVHSGSHLGKEAADITLMQGRPEQILDYLNLAKTVNQKIKQSLIFALFYNTISIPIAMSGLLTPLVAVCAMLLSSLSVTGNALLLKKKARKEILS
jgi:P-type E1-E2 ATPase